MKLQDLIKKVTDGETLTDDERESLKAFDYGKMRDAVATEARKSAESKAAELQKQLDELATTKTELEKKLNEKDNAGKSELEKAQMQLSELSKMVNGLKGEVEKSQKEKSQLERKHSLNQIRTKHGIQFVDGLDHGMLDRSFETAFEGVDDLTDENVLKVKVDTWKAMNKAAILDNTGHGSGDVHHPGTPARRAGKTPDQQTDEERAAEIRKNRLS